MGEPLGLSLCLPLLKPFIKERRKEKKKKKRARAREGQWDSKKVTQHLETEWGPSFPHFWSSALSSFPQVPVVLNFVSESNNYLNNF